MEPEEHLKSILSRLERILATLKSDDWYACQSIMRTKDSIEKALGIHKKPSFKELVKKVGKYGL